MKSSLSGKLVLAFVCTTTVVLIFCLVNVFFRTSAIITDEIKQKALMLITIYESQLYEGYDQENPTGYNVVFQKLLNTFKTAIPEIIEINLYKLGANPIAVASTDESMLGKKADPEDVKSAKNNITVVLFDEEDHRKIIDITQPLHYQNKIDYVIGIKIDTIKDQNQINTLILQTFIIGFIAILALVIIVLVLSRIITKPLLKINESFKDISEGSGDLTKVLKVETKDEIGKISVSFNMFLNKLKIIIDKLKTVIIRSHDLGNDLAANSSEVSATVEEMSSTMNSMNDRTNFLNEEIKKVDTSINNLNKTIEKVFNLIIDQSNSINESSAAIEQTIANLNNLEKVVGDKKAQSDDLSDMAKKGEISMHDTVSSIEEISKSTELIVGMIKVINNVSQQTNLLGMNAAIEAAHAGEYGRGFAVVADEIRKLAETTSLNAKTISGSLKKVIQKINSTSSATKSTNEIINNIIRGIQDVSNSMNEMLSGLNEMAIGSQHIITSLTNLTNINEDVRSSSNEMKNGTSVMDGSIKQIVEISNENKVGVSEITAGINEISKAVVMLSDLSNNNYQNIRQLEDEIGNFKTGTE